ncbi:MAG: hypothetical protein Q8S55_02680 [Methylococcaceae bacterium]|nr:hypothetical protein [Methylococcaceae bacterium]
MSLKNRVVKLEAGNTSIKLAPLYIHFHGVNPDKSEPELLGYAHTSRGKETRIMRLAGESVHDFKCRCKDRVPIPEGAGAVIFMAIYADEINRSKT